MLIFHTIMFFVTWGEMGHLRFLKYPHISSRAFRSGGNKFAETKESHYKSMKINENQYISIRFKKIDENQ